MCVLLSPWFDGWKYGWINVFLPQDGLYCFDDLMDGWMDRWIHCSSPPQTKDCDVLLIWWMDGWIVLLLLIFRWRTVTWWPPSWSWSWTTCCGFWRTPSWRPWSSTPSPWAKPWRSQPSSARAWPQRTQRSVTHKHYHTHTLSHTERERGLNNCRHVLYIRRVIVWEVDYICDALWDLPYWRLADWCHPDLADTQGDQAVFTPKHKNTQI